MKVLSPEAPRPRTARRFSKPQMEKRRRERINHNLETLRLLMLENTDDENMKNPKVGKAEILESVVQFLKSGKDARRQEATELQAPSRASQQAYEEGRRSCLLRISHFISTKGKGLMEASEEGPVQASFRAPLAQAHSGRLHTSCDSRLSPPFWLQQQAAPQPQPQPHLTSSSSSRCELFSPHTDPVWRPWPQ